jgi:parallel beta-helix repeat protein
MKKEMFILLSFLLFLALFAISASAADCGGNIACNCGDSLNASRTLNSSDNLSACSGSGLQISKSNVTLNCNGTVINSSSSGLAGAGVVIVSQDNVSIKNCVFTNFIGGVYANVATNLTLDNNTVNYNQYGIYLTSGSQTNVSNNLVNSNWFYGIYLANNPFNRITNNLVNLNKDFGILILSSSNNTITQNNVSSGNFGIAIANSPNSTLSSNNMSTNNYNFMLYEYYSPNIYLTYNISTNNIVNEKPVYYVLNAKNQNYNESTNAGFFACINCTNMTVKNLNLSNNYDGLLLYNTTNSSFSNLTLTDNYHGAYLYESDNNSISNSTIDSNSYGIYFYLGNGNYLTNSMIKYNSEFGTLLSISDLNTFINNTWYKNRNHGVGFDGNYTNYYYNNSFIDSANPVMIDLSFSSDVYTLNQTVDFSVAMYTPNGVACNDCNTSAAISPKGSNLVYVRNATGNVASGNFTLSRFGLYSGIINVTDANGNYAEIKGSVYVNTSTDIKRYYFRVTNPTHSQPLDINAKSFLTTPPTTEEIIPADISNKSWVQASIDEKLGKEALSIESINIYLWYNASGGSPYVGIQRFATYDSSVDYNQTISNTTEYNFTNINFTNLGWTTDYLTNFYGVTVKLVGIASYIKTNSTNQSYIDVVYKYSIGLNIKSISNPEINLLSATTPQTEINNASIVLEGKGNTSMVVAMPDTTSNYTVMRDSIDCGISNSNCNFTQSNGEINFTNIALGSQHTITIEKIVQAVEEAVIEAVGQIGVGKGAKINKTIEAKPQPKKIGLFTRWNINQIIQQNYMFFVFIGIFITISVLIIVRGRIKTERMKRRVVISRFGNSKTL